jgi:hypothetical protein
MITLQTWNTESNKYGVRGMSVAGDTFANLQRSSRAIPIWQYLEQFVVHLRPSAVIKLCRFLYFRVAYPYSSTAEMYGEQISSVPSIKHSSTIGHGRMLKVSIDADSNIYGSLRLIYKWVAT